MSSRSLRFETLFFTLLIAAPAFAIYHGGVSGSSPAWRWFPFEAEPYCFIEPRNSSSASFLNGLFALFLCKRDALPPQRLRARLRRNLQLQHYTRSVATATAAAETATVVIITTRDACRIHLRVSIIPLRYRRRRAGSWPLSTFAAFG